MSGPAAGESLRSLMDRGPMSPYQWGAVALCVLLNIVDGFDILVMAFTATGVTNEWGLSGAELGLLLSSGLVGMALGSLFVAPFADRIGRRPLVLMCLVVVALGMGGSALSQSPVQLGLIRVVTGIGMGGIIVCSNVMAGEFASRRWRGLAVGLNTTGYAFGASMGGVVAVALQDTFSWRAVFVFGAAMTLVALMAVALAMPESPDYLATSTRPAAAARLQRVATRMRFGGALAAGVSNGDVHPRPTGTMDLLRGEHRRSVIVMCTAFFCTMFGYYVVQSWTPRLLVIAGFSEGQANLGGTVLNAGGMAGAVVIGVLAIRFRVKSLIVAFQVLTAILLCVFSVSTGASGVALVIACVIGMTANACMAGMYALCTALFPTEIRATAVGTAITVGRVGAIVAPTVVGALVDLSWSIVALYAAMSVVFVLAAAAVARARTGGRDAPRQQSAGSADLEMGRATTAGRAGED